jgi:hypothetical protein
MKKKSLQEENLSFINNLMGQIDLLKEGQVNGDSKSVETQVDRISKIKRALLKSKKMGASETNGKGKRKTNTEMLCKIWFRKDGKEKDLDKVYEELKTVKLSLSRIIKSDYFSQQQREKCHTDKNFEDLSRSSVGEV